MAKSNTTAALILGVAAGVALLKFINMPKEDKDDFISYLKNKTNDLLDDAEATVEKVEHFMDEVKSKGEDGLVDKLYVLKRMFSELYGSHKRFLL